MNNVEAHDITYLRSKKRYKLSRENFVNKLQDAETNSNVVIWMEYRKTNWQRNIAKTKKVVVT